MNTPLTVQSIHYTVLSMVLYTVLALSPVHAETTNCTAITSVPYTISTQGVYCFTGHLSTSITSGKAITISTNNVTIDMNGYKLGGLAAGVGTSAVGIYAYQRKNITIRNGIIRGFFNGISLSDTIPYTVSQGHLIEDIRADQNTYLGISVQGRGNTVRRNQVVDTGGTTNSNFAYGMYIPGSGARLLDNDIIGVTATSAAYGIYLYNGDGSVVKDNRIDNISGTGIYTYNSSGLLLRANDITNAIAGINFVLSIGKYMDNLTSNVSTPFNGGTAVGIND